MCIDVRRRTSRNTIRLVHLRALPAYAPELNPVEQCWNHTKYADLANFIPDDLDHLQQAVEASITEQSRRSGTPQVVLCLRQTTDCERDH